MSETAVRVDLREATLSESAKLHEGDGDPFLTLDHPPPVRSLLRVGEGEDVRVFEVGRVIEVVDEHEPARGCYGKFVELERLEEQRKVGSEHLEPGISGGGGGIPAPVMMSPSDMMMSEAGSDEDEAAAAAAGDASSDGEGETDDESSDSDESESGDGDGQSGDDSESDDDGGSDDD